MCQQLPAPQPYPQNRPPHAGCATPAPQVFPAHWLPPQPPPKPPPPHPHAPGVQHCPFTQLWPPAQQMLPQHVLPDWHTVPPHWKDPGATHWPLRQLPVLQQLPPHTVDPGGQHTLPLQVPEQHWPPQMVWPAAQHMPLPAQMVPAEQQSTADGGMGNNGALPLYIADDLDARCSQHSYSSTYSLSNIKAEQ
jgi:hypothetical protein